MADAQQHAVVSRLKAAANEAIARTDASKAVELLTSAIALDSKMAVLYNNRAYAHSLLSQHVLALADARMSMVLAPGSSKGCLRAGRALLGLERYEEAEEVLFSASQRFPQDYLLKEALADVEAARNNDAALNGGVSASEAEKLKAIESKESNERVGLESSYYYAAVPSSQLKLPVTTPERILLANAGPDGSQATPAVDGSDANRPMQLAAAGAVQRDIEQKGLDSYYYAHAREKDYHVPTVPKRIEADGSLTPWRPSPKTR
mmetsp:Transcript_4683/g.10178  ORF Transcript_4683/g.10178 Transcript_4683/m.10178 type:complete len:262 (-) Transcript_4683:214-999(-)